MTKQEKQLLLIDLCARLPYGVKANIPLVDGDERIYTVSFDDMKDFVKGYINIKPCLRPMSSMTEEEKRTYTTLRAHALPFTIVAWLDENMFDHRTNSEGEHLIESGIALEAKEGMYK